MPGDLNLKKSWHPGLHKNQAVVHAKEQEALEERRRIQERQKEIKQQRERDELLKLQEMATGKKRVQKVEWMYQDPTAVGSKQAFSEKKVDANATDDYLLGKRRIDSIVKQKGDLEAFDDSLDRFKPKSEGVDAQEIVHKVKDDPMVAVRRKGRELGYTDEANESERRSRRERSRSRERERRRPRRKREDSRDRRNRRDKEREGDRRRRRRDGERSRRRERREREEEERGRARDRSLDSEGGRGSSREDRDVDIRSSRDDRSSRYSRDERSFRDKRGRSRSRSRSRDRYRNRDSYRDRSREERERSRDRSRERLRSSRRDRGEERRSAREDERRSREEDRRSREEDRRSRDDDRRWSSGRSSRSSRDRSRSRDVDTRDRDYRSRSRDRVEVSGESKSGELNSGRSITTTTTTTKQDERLVDVNASDASLGYRADNELSPSRSPVTRSHRDRRDSYRPGYKEEDAKRCAQRKEKEKEVDALPKGLQQMRAKLLASKKSPSAGAGPTSVAKPPSADKAATDAILSDRLARLKAMQDDAKALEEERDERLASKNKHEEAERLRDALLRQKSAQLGRSEFAREEERRDLK